MWVIVDGSGLLAKSLSIFLIILRPNPLLTNINICDIIPNPLYKTYKKIPEIHNKIIKRYQNMWKLWEK
jgi:hypothetical protein